MPGRIATMVARAVDAGELQEPLGYPHLANGNSIASHFARRADTGENANLSHKG